MNSLFRATRISWHFCSLSFGRREWLDSYTETLKHLRVSKNTALVLMGGWITRDDIVCMQWLEPNKGYGSAPGKVPYAFEPRSENRATGRKSVKCITGQKLTYKIAQKVYLFLGSLSQLSQILLELCKALWHFFQLWLEHLQCTMKQGLSYMGKAITKCLTLEIDFSANFHLRHDFFWIRLS